MEPRTRESNGVVDAALMFVVLMWALTFSTFKVAWRNVDPVAFTAVRFAATVVIALAVVMFAKSRVRPRRADLPTIVASGLAGYFAYQLLFILGLDRTTAVASAILVSTHPLFSVVFAWLLGRERPTRRQLLGIAVAFLGVVVFLRVWDAVGTATWGDLLSLGAAAAFGAYGVINQPLSKRYPPRELMAYTLAVGGGLVALVGLPAAVHQDWGALNATDWLIMLYAIVGPVYLAYALWNWAIHKRGIARTTPYGFAVPVVAAVLAVIFLGESLHPEQIVGGLLVVAGLVVTRMPSRRRLAATAPAEGALERAG
ncbi:MAG TPA: DMT family transporter [Actinomycetota bacterium]